MKRPRWNRMTPVWLGWGLYFIVAEGYAVATRDSHPGGSLSSLVWRFTEHPAQKVAFMLGWALLTYHFLWRRKQKP